MAIPPANGSVFRMERGVNEGISSPGICNLPG